MRDDRARVEINFEKEEEKNPMFSLVLSQVFANESSLVQPNFRKFPLHPTKAVLKKSVTDQKVSQIEKGIAVRMLE